MAISIKKLTDVNSTIFDDLKKVYYCADTIDTVNDINKTHTLLQLPITEDGVTLNMGGVNTTFKKLNTGEVWGSTVDRDDPEVSFNVASVSADVNAMFMGEGAVSNVKLSDPSSGGDVNLTARGYALELKAVTGSLWFPAENGDGWIVLPSIKMYGGLNGTDDSNTAYFACSVTPNTNKTDGVSLYIVSGSSKSDKSADFAGYKTIHVQYSNAIVGSYTKKTGAEVVAAAKADGYTISLSESNFASAKDGGVVDASAYTAPSA